MRCSRFETKKVNLYKSKAMGATPLDKELMQYWSGLTVVQQESVLRVIKEMVHPELGVSIEQYNREIDEATARVEAGQFTSHEDVVKMSKDW